MSSGRVGRPKGENVVNTKRRRKQLVDAAIESIVENGLSATTLATVAKSSGLSQGTAVFYFKSKESLLFEAFRFCLEEYRSAWSDALDAAGPDPVDRIVAQVFSSLSPQLLTHQNLAFWNSFWPEASRNKTLNATFERYDAERKSAQLSLCEDAGPLLADTLWTPKTAAHALETMIEGVWSQVYYSPENLSARDARTVVATLLSTMFPSRSYDIMRKAEDPANDN